jgi:hypothetical protein
MTFLCMKNVVIESKAGINVIYCQMWLGNIITCEWLSLLIFYKGKMGMNRTPKPSPNPAPSPSPEPAPKPEPQPMRWPSDFPGKHDRYNWCLSRGVQEKSTVPSGGLAILPPRHVLFLSSLEVDFSKYRWIYQIYIAQLWWAVTWK